MGYIHDLSEPFTPPNFHRARPGPVRQFNAKANTRKLVLEWHPPVGGATFYRIERTLDGHAYELVREISGTWICLDAPKGDGWFYRVTAANPRGQSDFRLVWFFRRARPQPMLIPIPVRPGLRVNISA